MKKPKNVSRTKMLMLLSLMFLSIAVLCMGVLAAESAIYNIAGNISYNMVDYVARINTRVYKVEGQTDETGLATGINTLATMTFEQIEKSTTTPYYILSQKLDTGAITRTSDTTTEITKSVEIEYGAVDSSVEYYTFYIVINIKEITGDYLLSASLNETVSSSTTSYKKSNQSQSLVANSETRNIVIGFSLKSTTANSTESFSYTLTVNASIAKDFSVELIDGGTYWYITLGTGKVLTTSSNTVASENTDIKWRLVSLDGEEKYDYTSTKPTKHVGAVFVQETAVNSALAFDSSSSQNYYNSSIRTSIKDGSYFNLTSSDDLSFIKDRKIESINYWKYQNLDSTTGSYLTYDSSKEALKSEDSSTDKFWLLSCEEVTTFFDNTSASRKWLNSDDTSGVHFWLRSPSSYNSINVCGVYSIGILFDISAGNSGSLRVRAAFQLV